MNKSQRDYAVARVSSVARDKINSLYEEHGWEDKYLSVEEAWTLIESNKVKFKKGFSPNRYSKLLEAFDFSPFEKRAGISTKGKTEVEKVERELQETKDRIYLSGSEEVIEVIKSFTEKYA